MGTAYSDIFDKALTQFRDWRIDSIYNASVPDFEEYMTGFLTEYLPLFAPLCDQDLSHNDTTKEFDVTLSDDNILVVSKYLMLAWLEREVSDIGQMELHLNDRQAFKTYSAANNLDKKKDYLQQTRENIDLIVNRLAWSKVDWSEWGV